MFGKRPGEPLSWDQSVGSNKKKTKIQYFEKFRQQRQSITNKISPVLDFIFSHTEGDERPYIEVEVLGFKIKGLLDSGANRSVVGSKGFTLLKSLGLRLQRSKSLACTFANQQTLTVIGAISVPMRLEDRVRMIEVLVVPELQHILILGVDFWVQMEIIPNLRKGEWSFHSQGTHDSVVDSIENFFSTMNPKLGYTHLVEHHIVTAAQPIKQRYYPVSPAVQAQIDIEQKLVVLYEQPHTKC